MNTNTIHHIGMDVSKDKLDIYDPRTQNNGTTNNSPKKIALKLSELNKEKNIHIICEPTGGYEKDLLNECWKAEIPISLVSPQRARAFAEAFGIYAKTDPIDAMLLSRFGESLKPKPRLKPTKTQEKLSAAVREKDRLTRQRAAQKTTLKQTTDTFVKKEIMRLISYLDKAITRCEKQLLKLIETDSTLVDKKRKIESIKGLGEGAASVLIAEMPELGKITDNQASALVGVAPFNKESGSHKGKRRVRGGRHLVRRSLYMPALSAISHNPILKEFYDRLIDDGKPHHVAITAVIRKLVRLVNKMFTDPCFEPQK